MKILIYYFCKIYNKNFILKYVILYIHCVNLLMWSPTKLNFLFYIFV
jgi:hypothetical protein